MGGPALERQQASADKASPWAGRVQRLAQQLRGGFMAPRARWAVISLSLLLCGSALWVPRTTDDYFHQLVLTGQDARIPGLDRAPHDLFSFTRGDPDENQQLMEAGILPWYADPNVSIRFLRVLSSWTLWLDYQLWPGRGPLMHLHSLLWFALLLGVLSAVYRRFSRAPWVAVLALLLYGIDDSRAPALGWIAGRHTFVSLALACPVLLTHHRWRSQASRGAAWLGTLLLALALLAGETTVAVCAYLLAYALCLDPAPLRSRLASLLPYGAVLVIWRLAYGQLGYGAHGSGLYLDPGAAPLAYLQATLTRLPVLLLSQLTLPVADYWEGLPVASAWAQPAVLIAALAVLAGMARLLAPLWKRDALVRFWTVGTLLAAALACAGMPHDRLLNAVGIGASALIASLLACWIESVSQPRPRRLAGWALALIHLVLAPLMLPVRMQQVAVLEPVMARIHASIPPAELPEQTLVLVNPPVDGIAALDPIYRAAQGIPQPKHYRWLATGLSDLLVKRVDRRTLLLRPAGGFVRYSAETMFRSPALHSRRGDRVALSNTTFELAQITPDGRPAEVLVRFDRDLEDPSLRWMQWQGRAFAPFEPPAVGESRVLPAIDLFQALL